MVGMSNLDDVQPIVEGEEYVVERIINHRFRNGRKEFFLAWKGFPDSDNTWEPESNLDCPDLIAEYEARVKFNNRYVVDHSQAPAPPSNLLKRKGSSLEEAAPQIPQNKRGRPPNASRQEQVSSSAGGGGGDAPEGLASMGNGTAFDRGREAEKVLGATDAMGELMLLVQWKGTGEADLVPARIANVRCPQVVIRFYEERLTWINNQNSTGTSGGTNEAGGKGALSEVSGETNNTTNNNNSQMPSMS